MRVARNHILSIAIIAISSLLLFSCKKNSNDSKPSDDECVIGRSATDGNVISGQYIVSYQPSVINTRSMSSQRVAEMSQRILSENFIKPSALMVSFAGEPGGFVARL